MNIVSMLAGEPAGMLAEKLATPLLNKLMPSTSSNFLDAFNNAHKEKLSLDDFPLSDEDRLTLTQTREFAMERGLDSIEVEIDGKAYKLNTEDFSFTPMV